MPFSTDNLGKLTPSYPQRVGIADWQETINLWGNQAGIVDALIATLDRIWERRTSQT